MLSFIKYCHLSHAKLFDDYMPGKKKKKNQPYNWNANLKIKKKKINNNKKKREMYEKT